MNKFVAEIGRLGILRCYGQTRTRTTPRQMGHSNLIQSSTLVWWFRAHVLVLSQACSETAHCQLLWRSSTNSSWQSVRMCLVLVLGSTPAECLATKGFVGPSSVLEMCEVLQGFADMFIILSYIIQIISNYIYMLYLYIDLSYPFRWYR